ncbi:7-dehydrocholesterol reductase [Halotydeus destructor]|nr:7-dehydrocholesterol reductase [Halotydeus destructor]
MVAQSSTFERFYLKVVRETLFPIVLIVVTVNAAIILPYAIVHKNSNLSNQKSGLIGLVKSSWRSVNWTDWSVWTAVGVLFLWSNLSLLLPGKEFHGPPTQSGFRPTYYRSGPLFYILTMATVVPLVWSYPMLAWYYKFTTLSAILVISGILFCIFLFVKGHTCPSPGDFGSSGNPIFDFYWGLELYPRYGFDNLFDWKTIVISRFSLIVWQAIVLVAWKANYELHTAAYRKGDVSWSMSAATILQTVYLIKFYLWEDGYMSTIDTSVDRFGFYVAWGCIAWVPNFYTLTSLYLVKHTPSGIGVVGFGVCVVLGLSMTILTYLADRQRQVCREKGGKFSIFGKPAKVIHAVYENQNGEKKRNTLLVSGFWGISRHFNYVLELGSALIWSACGGWSSWLPYLYFIFLLILLVHRSHRDERKCRAKYGKYWEAYCTQVPFKMVPYLY